MARPRKTKTNTAPENNTLDRPSAIASDIADQVRTLFGRNWRDIQEILDDGDTGNEIKLAFGVTITDRPATPGEQASKDNRCKTSMTFSVKHSDSIESPITDPAQMELGEQPAQPPDGDGEPDIE